MNPDDLLNTSILLLKKAQSKGVNSSLVEISLAQKALELLVQNNQVPPVKSRYHTQPLPKKKLEAATETN